MQYFAYTKHKSFPNTDLGGPRQIKMHKTDRVVCKDDPRESCPSNAVFSIILGSRENFLKPYNCKKTKFHKKLNHNHLPEAIKISNSSPKLDL